MSARTFVAATLGALGATAWAAPPIAPEANAERELVVCADPANLPYSNSRQEGYENRIAALLAEELHARLSYAWNLQRRSFLRRTLNAGRCDVVIGLPAGLQGVAQTRPYYRSSYVAVTRPGQAWPGLDDPRLRSLKIGLQAVGAEGANTPPAMALARRGITDKVSGYAVWGDEADETPQARLLDAVASGEIDVAIVWGPIAGYFAQPYRPALQLAAVTADPQWPALAFSYAMALSVRRADTALRDELQQVLDRRQADIQAILRGHGVPLLDEAAVALQPLAAWQATPASPSTLLSTTPTQGLLARTSGD
jgi:mxaJ protein